MITKETFVDTMNRLQELDAKMGIADEAMRNLCYDFGSFYILDVFDITISLLQEVFKDKNNWIGYFVYERNWLRDFQLGDIMVHGEPVKIENWEDVYDFLVSCMEE